MFQWPMWGRAVGGGVCSLMSHLKSHGRRSPVGCSPWGCSESDRTERLHFHFSPSCIGEGNGNPLKYSCLENPMDRGVWQATVHGITKESDMT